MNKRPGRRLLIILFLSLIMIFLFFSIIIKSHGYDVTFFLVSDLHYGLSPTVLSANERTVEAMNILPGVPWPENLGRSPVAPPRGVIVLGDLLNDGANASADKWWDDFTKDYGVNGEGKLKYPCYESFGNHDGGESDVVRQGIKERNKMRPGVTNLSINGINYSWDWDKVHFVHLGLYAGRDGDDFINPWGKHFEGNWRFPGHSLEFLEQDLAKNVGRSGRPVILLQHYGFDEWGLGWWSEKERQAFYEVIKNYRVIAIFWGHSHYVQFLPWKGLPTWCVGAGQHDPEPGEFLVVHLTPKWIMVAERRAGKENTWGSIWKINIGTASLN